MDEKGFGADEILFGVDKMELFQLVLDLLQLEERLDRGQPVDIGVFQQLSDPVEGLGMCIEDRQLHLGRRYFL
jgi:hypothetical protein